MKKARLGWGEAKDVYVSMLIESYLHPEKSLEEIANREGASVSLLKYLAGGISRPWKVVGNYRGPMQLLLEKFIAEENVDTSQLSRGARYLYDIRVQAITQLGIKSLITCPRNKRPELSDMVERNRNIIERVSKGETYNSVAKLYGVTRQRIEQVVKREGTPRRKQLDP